LLYIQKYSSSIGYDELVSTKEMVAIILRGSIGVCGAALLYFFLHSGIITGSLVPTIDKISVEFIQPAVLAKSLNASGVEAPFLYPRLLVANKDLALLIIWGFLAGFSERLLPSILATTESRLASTTGKADLHAHLVGMDGHNGK
jgi:hypothetical protein